MLEARIIAKRLPAGDLLLQDIAFTVAPGETLALLGASGTGKSTTLRILLGLDRRFDGAVRNTACRVGALFQEPRLLPWRTVGDNIRLALPPGAPPPDLAALLDSVGLSTAAELYPRQLSLGMARRAALARALAITPDLLVLDEPFASLDPGTAGLIAARLARERVATILAMHDVAQAVALAKRIIVLAGRPATVAGRVDIPPAASESDRAALQATLKARFPFLAAPERHADGLPHLREEG